MSIRVIHKIAELREFIKQRQHSTAGSVGLIPTMGYLHKGHQSLMHLARENNDIVVLSIFVNPLQFGPNEDLDQYPRDLDRDLQIAEGAGVDVVFAPTVREMYPSATLTKVTVEQVTESLCGSSRPGHFDGVATVVTKLFNIVQPDRAYFGMKDAQQIAVIEQMVQDLNIPVQIVPCPTIREQDGLALSSRNVYLTPEQRQEALVLNRSLQSGEEALRAGTVSIQGLREMVMGIIAESPLADIDYVEVLAYPSLKVIADNQKPEKIIVALAVRFGTTRLIDNRVIFLK